MAIDVGARLKALRKQFGLSQRELAKRAGVTNGMISLIEQNRVSPSVSSLHKVLSALPMTMAEFFTREHMDGEVVVYRAAELPDVGTHDVEYRLVASSRSDRAMSILHEHYPPGSDTGEEMLSHDGEEGGVVVRGELELTVGGKSWVLGPGDAYYFESRLPHRFRNLGDVSVEIVSANAPPTF